MMRDLWNALPDDRPVTSVCVVEDPHKSPAGFSVVARTYDQDTDADLWKEGFFGKKITRYLCHSKTEGQPNYIVDSMIVINDKDLPPEGFTALTHTRDTEQKATKKRIICYRTQPRDKVSRAVTDVIVLSKSKKAPSGFTLAGDMNGHLICFKMTDLTKGSQNPVPIPNSTSSGSSASYTMDRLHMSPGRNVMNASSVPPTCLPYPVTTATSSGPVPAPSQLYPVDQLQGVTNSSSSDRNVTLPRNLEYGRTWHASSQYATPNKMPPYPLYSGQGANRSQRSAVAGNAPSGLDGILFEVNQKFKELNQLSSFVIPNVDGKTKEQIEAEYSYDFCLERQTIQRFQLQDP